MSFDPVISTPPAISRRQAPHTMADVLEALRAAGEETRLRILLLLDEGELTITDLTQVLGQSQPRVSRHIKILCDAGLVERHREGSWTILRIARSAGAIAAVSGALRLLDETLPERRHDRLQLEKIKSQRHDQAQKFFRAEAANWASIRSLHVDEARVEEAILTLVEDQQFDRLIDLGTGTGRMLELLADNAAEAIGIDVNAAMLAYARTQIDKPGLRHVQIRHGDIFSLPQYTGTADLVVLHQVLHFLPNPGAAIAQAGRLLQPGGRILIVDFAPHTIERLRNEENHARLGFSPPQMARWLRDAALGPLHHRDLPPDDQDGGQHLTVSLWLAERPAVATLHNATRSSPAPIH